MAGEQFTYHDTDGGLAEPQADRRLKIHTNLVVFTPSRRAPMVAVAPPNPGQSADGPTN